MLCRWDISTGTNLDLMRKKCVSRILNPDLTGLVQSVFPNMHTYICFYNANTDFPSKSLYQHQLLLTNDPLILNMVMSQEVSTYQTVIKSKQTLIIHCRTGYTEDMQVSLISAMLLSLELKMAHVPTQFFVDCTNGRTTTYLR